MLKKFGAVSQLVYLPIVIALAAFYFNFDNLSGIWFLSLAILIGLAVWTDRREAQWHLTPAALLVGGLWMGSYEGIVLVLFSELLAGGAQIYSLVKLGAKKIDEPSRQVSLLGVTGALALLLYYATEQQFVEPGALLALYLLFRATGFQLTDISAKLRLTKSAPVAEAFDIFYPILVPATLFLMIAPTHFEFAQALIPALVAMAALSGAIRETLLLSLLTLSIKDPFVASLLGPLVILFLSPHLGGYAGTALVAFAMLITKGAAGDEFVMAITATLAAFIGRTLALGQPRLNEPAKEVAVGAAALIPILVYAYQHQQDYVQRLYEIDPQLWIHPGALLVSYGTFLFLRNSQNPLTRHIRTSSAWNRAVEWLKATSRLPVRGTESRLAPGAKSPNRFESLIFSEGFQVFRWVIILGTALWGALWVTN
jgi:hypothetical protein